MLAYSYSVLLVIAVTTVTCRRQPWLRSGPQWSSVANGFNPYAIPSNSGSSENPEVTIRDGKLKGFTMRTVTSRPFSAFQGIPFAQPPEGPLRFQDPIKNLPWNGTRDAIAPSPQCIQLDLMTLFEVFGQENCLFLSVYTPNLPKSGRFNKKLPVMVWIFGGGFFMGAGSIYGPEYLLNHDIVLVTINYRLGPFGFLSTGDDASPGNQGLKDQVLSLKWVQNNIHAFGGDANSVTVFGESAGAVSIQHLIVSPVSRGLMHRGISQSGSGLCYWSILENSASTARRVGEMLNCTGTSQNMVNCLRSVDAQAIASVQLSLTEWNIFPLVIFGPVVEHNHPGAFLTETPEKAYRAYRAARIPWITGFTQDEMVWMMSALIQNATAVSEVNSDWERVGPIILGLENTTNTNVEIGRQIREFYMGNEDFSFETRHNFSRLFGDRFILECGLEAMRYHSQYTGAPVYGYRFSYQGRYSIVQKNGQDPQDWGVAHLDDLIYLFNNTDYFTITLQPGDEEFRMSQIMTNIWSNFATFG
ncbi:Esterase FE4 [Orchesella cincta]|uniref:Carboxylic ester hydrolase n=1 Tax=Orchesella cincta TaxID=48709 RepID=A0A1D2MRK7_ORCCI|nr:Esterase FE4 [Orchesella cincta]